MIRFVWGVLTGMVLSFIMGIGYFAGEKVIWTKVGDAAKRKADSLQGVPYTRGRPSYDDSVAGGLGPIPDATVGWDR